MLRPNKLVRVMIEVELQAQWATCQRGRVGAALVTDDFQVLVVARNGTPRGISTCAELGSNPHVRCTLCIHAERNLINRAARVGMATEGRNVVSLVRPCEGCTNDLVEAGVKNIYYRNDYETDGLLEYVNYVLDHHKIGLFKVAMSEEEQTFSKILNEWRRTWTD